VLLEEGNGFEEEVVEIEGNSFLQIFFVGGVNGEYFFLEVALGEFAVSERADLLRFGVGDLSGDAGWFVRIGTEVHVGEDVFDGFALVDGVVDDEIFGDIDMGAVDAEEFDAKTVEGTGIGGNLAGESLDAVLHFFGGFVGEGEEENLGGVKFLVGDKPSGAMSEDFGFSGTSASEDEQGAALVSDGLELVGIEFGKERVCHNGLQ